jgi:archaemetzincin
MISFSYRCNIIYIQPFGDFNDRFPRSPNLDIISAFSHIFFPECPTEILPSINFDNKMETRINQYTNQPQYLVSDLIVHLKKMQRKRKTRQELFSIGVTTVDIYPSPQWNFVYGEASIDEGIAIYSFARLDPLFPHSSQKPCTDEERILILKRAVNTYLHETMHLFGLKHCIYYLCLMNGTNCENEMDRQLLYLCPICLRKMYIVFRKQNYDIINMYQNLLELSKKIGFKEEINWYENRLKILSRHF